MVREYFTLIGYLSSTMKGEQKLNDAGFFQVATKLAFNSDFDYISRLLISNVDISRRGTPAQNAYFDNIVAETLNKDTTVSISLLVHTLNAIGWSLLSGTANSTSWGLEKLYQALNSCFSDCVDVSIDVLNHILGGKSSLTSIRLLIELLKSDTELQPLNEKCMKYFEALSCRGHILKYIISLDAGLAYAESIGWINMILEKYKGNNQQSGSTENEDGSILSVIDDAFISKCEASVLRSLMPDEFLKFPEPDASVSHDENPTTESYYTIPSLDEKTSVTPVPYEFIGPWIQRDGDRAYASKTVDWFSRFPWHLNTVTHDNFGKANITSVCTYRCRYGHLSSLSDDNTNHIVLESVFLNEYGQQTTIEIKENNAVSVKLQIGDYEIDTYGFLKLNASALRKVRAISIDSDNGGAQSSSNTLQSHGSQSLNTPVSFRNARSSFNSVEDIPSIAQIKESRRHLVGGRPASPSSNMNSLNLDDDSFGDDEEYVPDVITFSKATLEQYLQTLQISEDKLESDAACRSLHLNHARGQWYLTYDLERKIWHITGISFYLRLKPGLDLHVPFPNHILQGLCKTENGLKVMLRDVVDYDTLCRDAFKSVCGPRKQRLALWILGYILSSENGLNYVFAQENPNAIEELVKLSETSPYMSLRSTCLNVLGLVASSSPVVRGILLDYGWDSANHVDSTCILPINIEKYFGLSTFENSPTCTSEGYGEVIDKYGESIVRVNDPTEDSDYKANGNRAKIHLLRSSLIELTNPLSSKDALKKVKELRSKHSSLFSSSNTFLLSYELLSRYRFQLHVRRYVHDIFKIGLGAFSKAIGEAEVA